MKLELTILVDVDDVVADLMGAWLARYNRDYDDNLAPQRLAGWEMEGHVKPECHLKIYDYLRDPSLYEEVEPVQGALAGVRELREMGHRVVFVTSSNAELMGAKLEWLVRQGFLFGVGHEFPDFVVANDKNLVRGDIIVDDRPKNVENFPGGRILFHLPRNTNFVGFGGVRAMHWTDVLSWVKVFVKRGGTFEKLSGGERPKMEGKVAGHIPGPLVHPRHIGPLPLQRPAEPVAQWRLERADMGQSVDQGPVRKFSTGATRDVDTNKLDYEGFLSPRVLLRFAQFMHKNRFQKDGQIRDSDNWQKGIPPEVYMKSKFRHFMEAWMIHRGLEALDEKGQPVDLEEALCAEMFNTMGYLHEVLKNKKVS